MFETHFFGQRPASFEAYAAAIEASVRALAQALPTNSYAGGAATALAQRLPPWHDSGGSMSSALDDLSRVIAASIAVYHPHTCAHLHCPVLIPALCAELVLTALNPSMDSFDQSGAATLIEQQVCDWTAKLIGYDANAGVTFTSGGTQSNYMGLLLARDRLLRDRFGWSAQNDGIPARAAGRLKIVCSEVAHFSIVKAAHQLGLGARAVLTVPVDAQARLEPLALERLLREQRAAGHEIIAVVATAGTTDAGAFDPIPAIERLCKQADIWLHVDAAWGGALLLSAQQRAQLVGLERADSVTLDFHKGFYQPVSCSAFALRSGANFDLIRHHADYLNPAEHEELGVPDLVTRSLLTTRRCDALKIWLTLRVVGAAKLGAMVDQTLRLARFVGDHIRDSATFDLCCEPTFGAVLFRLRAVAGEDPDNLEKLHSELPQRLLHTGRGVIGFSKWQQRRCLKLTLLNPCSEPSELLTLLASVADSATEWRRAFLHSASSPG